MRAFQSLIRNSGQHAAGQTGMAVGSASATPVGSPTPTSELALSGGSETSVCSTQDGEGALTGALTPLVASLPVELDVTVPVRNFKVRNLIALVEGAVVESQWGHAEDVPLAAGEVQLAWCEFEVVETRMAVRLTRIA